MLQTRSKKVFAIPEPSTLLVTEWKWPAVSQNGPNDPEANSRTGPPVRALTDATSRHTVCLHRYGELKRGTLGQVYRDPQPAPVGFDDRTADR
ncbi:MAG: hypothetical protein JWL97_2045 [Gemmatimonadales bacterium]|nr:hypothetical protein [Gemmatimonadales bacterium]